jgi:hypothetical protein
MALQNDLSDRDFENFGIYPFVARKIISGGYPFSSILVFIQVRAGRGCLPVTGSIRRVKCQGFVSIPSYRSVRLTSATPKTNGICEIVKSDTRHNNYQGYLSVNHRSFQTEASPYSQSHVTEQ